MQYNSLTAAILAIFVFVTACIAQDVSTGDWIPFNEVGYPLTEKLDLANGVNTNERQYTVRGVATVVTSVDRWIDKQYHLLRNVFDGSLYHRTHGSHPADGTWLGNCPAGETSTMTITFDTVQDVSHIVVAQKGRWGYSHYSIDGYTNEDDVTDAIHITPGMVNTKDDIWGQVRVHPVKTQLRELVFYIYKTSTYCEMNEIEIFVRKDGE